MLAGSVAYAAIPRKPPIRAAIRRTEMAGLSATQLRVCGDTRTSRYGKYRTKQYVCQYDQLDALATLSALTWIQAAALADTYPDAEHREHVVEVELRAH